MSSTELQQRMATVHLDLINSVIACVIIIWVQDCAGPKGWFTRDISLASEITRRVPPPLRSPPLPQSLETPSHTRTHKRPLRRTVSRS